MTTTFLAVGAVLLLAAGGVADRAALDDGAAARGTADTAAVSAPPSAARGEEAVGPEAAAAVVRDYYRAIDARDYRRAYGHWSDDGGASGRTFEEFRSGFGTTSSVRVDVGVPGRVEPAAGSRYVEVPVSIRATTTDGGTERFRGAYVLRRSVVPGATAARRTWRLYSAEVRRVE